jgi:hypothetical protein
MSRAISPLPQYASMAWYSVKSTGTTLLSPFTYSLVSLSYEVAVDCVGQETLQISAAKWRYRMEWGAHRVGVGGGEDVATGLCIRKTTH